MGTERSNLVSRRAAFKPIAAAAFASAAVIPAIATAQPSSELHALWNKRRAIRPIYLQSKASIKAAENALPWWAQVGPMYLAHDGTFTGIDVGWPAIRELEPPKMPGSILLLRPSKYHLRKDYDQLCMFWGEPGRVSPKLRASYAKKLLRLRIRLREQAAERVKVGLPAIETRHDAIMEELSAINDAIEALPDQTADAVAASLMIELGYDVRLRDGTAEAIEKIARPLRVLLPSLTGSIAADVADLLDNPDTPITERMALIG
jgi:hypothetical protein